ncbi:hypothetical protein K461DRAFT_320261 [Myriangium duriaei CBS 260.36]|uniref:Stress-response A/B barrel domain-containing protein n=1 Tax=Myriangium duriaei CBS 260.36 TaxID=1168546 RepID=A0A9P4J259_9PEZI|nr:hypothetical protein K461DRAFT_320261 [Myriangium duriaei CBS 260.36]
MAIIHIVLFQFKDTLSTKEVDDVCQRMLALVDKCVHPKTGKPFIKSHGGGRDNSIEGFQGGFTHGFVYEFETREDRDYYVREDPAHQEFVAGLKDVLAGARVVDFTPGEF